ncbi:transcription factor cwo-like isoform X1 [Branchiostoma lanceolatum]|uniref:transcription factor cwo-like isoform X1 n=1 Tax=Branchiostoma lanceolatum TaxID=7740 RepID=UPI00345362CE
MAPAKRDQKEISSHKIVERRRRHRINTCIAQLSQAIPAAFSKSVNRVCRRGLSGKLEKAEVLEMAVSYVKHIQSNMKGQENRDSNTGDPGDPKRDEVDMRHFEEGYRECVKEVARYLAEVEGMNPQDVRFLRLLCHLQTRGPAARGLSNGKFGSVINFGIREPGVRDNHLNQGANTSAQSVPLPSNVTVTSRFNRGLLTNGSRKCSSPVKAAPEEDEEEKMEDKSAEDTENADRRSASSEIDVVNGEATAPVLSPTTSVTTSSCSSDVTQTSPPTLSVAVASVGDSSPTSEAMSSPTSPSTSPPISVEASVTSTGSSATVTSHPIAAKSRLVTMLSSPCVSTATTGPVLMPNPLSSLANMHTSLVSGSTSGFRSTTPSTTLACPGPSAGPLVTFLPQLPVPGMQGKLLPATPRLVVDPMTGQQFFVPQYIQVPTHVQVNPTAANHVIVNPSHVASSSNQNPLSQVIPSANHGPLSHMISTSNQTGMNTMMQCPALVTLAPHSGLLSTSVMPDTADAMKHLPGQYLHGIPVANFDIPLATHAQTPPAPINPIRALENIARKHPR